MNLLTPSIPCNAICFSSFVDNKWQRIGYVVNEILHDVDEAIKKNLITSVKFAWIKFITHRTRSGLGFFAGVAITKTG